MSDGILKVYVVKTPSKTFLSDRTDMKSYNSGSSLKHMVINDEAPKQSFLEDWYFVKGELESLKTMESQSPINKRYDLKDPSMASDKFPSTITKEEAVLGRDEDYDNIYSDIFKDIQSLYEYKEDAQESIIVDVEFEIVETMEFSELEESTGFSYLVQKTQWRHEGFRDLTEKEVRNQVLDRLVFPTIALPSRPCMLTSLQSYNIVRKHIQDNIDSKHAVITSDYDFCFTVKKKVKLSEQREWRVDVNNSIFQKRKRKSKWEKRYVNDREVEIFEMTHSPEGYCGYTPLPGFRGKTHNDLKKVIDEFLSELMAVINEPIEECKKCKGEGVQKIGKVKMDDDNKAVKS